MFLIYVCQMIEIRDLSNSITKTVKPPVQTNDIFYGGTASLLLSSPTAVLLYDIQQQKVLAEIATPPVKYVVWSTDGMLVALLSKHSLFLWYLIWRSANYIQQQLPSRTRPWVRAVSFMRPFASSRARGMIVVYFSTLRSTISSTLFLKGS
jgi:Coatomer WD associated region